MPPPRGGRERREKSEKFQSFNRPKIKVVRDRSGAIGAARKRGRS